MDNFTGRSKGFGFIQMPDCNSVNAAISDLNETEFDGRTIVVKLADGTRLNRDGNKQTVKAVVVIKEIININGSLKLNSLISNDKRRSSYQRRCFYLADIVS